jgi:Protein of unknown function (DUF3467)
MADNPKAPEPGAPQIQIDVDDQTAQGAYSNLVLINHNENEFVLDFAYIQPSAPRARVRSRVISSPRHTKRLLRALEHNVRRYEERFGKIEEPVPLTPPSPRKTGARANSCSDSSVATRAITCGTEPIEVTAT